jgi:hypothetical protein
VSLEARTVDLRSVDAEFEPRLPSLLEREVLSRLARPNPTLELAVLAMANPDFADAIPAWAAQVEQFADVATAAEVKDDHTYTTGLICPDRDLQPIRYNPESIGPYRVLQPIGSGGFGSVFLAQRGEGDKPVAVKVLTKQTPAGKGTIEREINLLSELDHPTIVDVHEFGETEDQYLYYSRL